MRSSTFNIFADHCPRALDHYEAGAPRDVSVFAEGIAAHAVLEKVGKRTAAAGEVLPLEAARRIATATIASLASDGRYFDGELQPPLPIQAAVNGAQAALDYLSLRPIEPRPGDSFEAGWAIDRDGNQFVYSDSAFWRAIIDRTYFEDTGDEEPGPRLLVIVDYKTAWPAGKGELDSIQRQAQTLCAAARAGDDVDGIKRTVVNVRKVQEWSDIVWIRDEQWRLVDMLENLRAAKAAADKRNARGQRSAIVGAGCCACPYILQCPDGLDYIDRAHAAVEFGTPEERARGWCAAKGAMDAYRAALEVDCREAPVRLDDGTEVGFHPSPGRELIPDAYKSVALDWGVDGAEGGLLAALGLGIRNVESLARMKGDLKNAKDREQWVESLTRPVVRSRFGARKVEGTEGGA